MAGLRRLDYDIRFALDEMSGLAKTSIVSLSFDSIHWRLGFYMDIQCGT